jgi:hypothetical protein
MPQGIRVTRRPAPQPPRNPDPSATWPTSHTWVWQHRGRAFHLLEYSELRDTSINDGDGGVGLLRSTSNWHGIFHQTGFEGMCWFYVQHDGKYMCRVSFRYFSPMTRLVTRILERVLYSPVYGSLYAAGPTVMWRFPPPFLPFVLQWLNSDVVDIEDEADQETAETTMMSVAEFVDDM